MLCGMSMQRLGGMGEGLEVRGQHSLPFWKCDWGRGVTSVLDVLGLEFVWLWCGPGASQ